LRNKFSRFVRDFLVRLNLVGRQTVRGYFDDNVAGLGAALAFYTVVSVAPLLMLAVLAAGVFFHDDSARMRVLGEIRQLIGADVWIGAVLTALLFDVGKTLLGLYLAHTRMISSFGAASSFMALLLWCYYAGQIFLIGAEFTRVNAALKGGRSRPAAH
jgi:uncharacterized BrkB/YihY/UPF0761 family membrane protein